MSKITKSEIKQIISEEIERFKKIKSLKAKKTAILESIEELKEGKSENWDKLQGLLDVTTKENLFDMLWNWQSGDEQEEFLEHAMDELGLSDEDEEEDDEDEEMISEGSDDEGLTNYMFFSNLKQIHKMAEEILAMDKNVVDKMLTEGHAWAVDHVATSKDDVEEVYNFLKTNVSINEESEISGWDVPEEEKKSMYSATEKWMKDPANNDWYDKHPSNPKNKEKTEGLDEDKMTKPEKKKREEIVMALKDKMSEFKKRYGKRAKDVMYATATKQAMEK